MKALVHKLAAVVLMTGLTPAFAHHSFAAFNMMKVVDFKGTVKEFHFTNPHSWIVLEGTDAAGNPVEMTFEANGPAYLVKTGWKRDTLKPGDVITISASPLRDGSPGGSSVKVTLADGRQLITR